MRKIVEHTADAGIEVEADSLPEAFEEIGKAFTEIVTGGKLTEPKNSNPITINANNLDSLLVNFLSGLIFLFDTENFLVSSARIDINLDSGFALNGTLFGDTYDQLVHGYGVEVKAVSYHLLEVFSGPPSRIKVILDL